MVGTKNPKHLRKAALVAFGLVLAAATSASAVTQTRFNKGSLIIPMEGPFQDPCGTVSAYGLIYKTLAASEALIAAGKPGITVHWLYKDTSVANGKKSPNRCVPTNLNKNPSTPTTCPAPYNDTKKCGSSLPYTDPNWNDGCDFKVVTQVQAPVTLIDNTTGKDVAASASCGNQVGAFCTRNTGGGADQYLSWPTFPSTIVQYTPSQNTNVHTVQYMGGTFVIEAADAPLFLSLLTDPAKQQNDLFGNAIDFSTFRQPADKTGGSNACKYAFDGTATVFSSTSGAANAHWVNIHRAQIGFDAIDSQKMSQSPSKIALLQTAGGSSSNGVVGDMLPKYLQSAGLNFTGAQGCSPTGYNAKALTGATSTNCPIGAKSGKIFDSFDVMDLQDPTELTKTYVSTVDGTTRPVYANFWAPHWEGSTFTGCDGTCINKARQTIQGYATKSNFDPSVISQKVGVMAECGSIAVLEGSQGTSSFDPGMPGDGNFAANWWYPPQRQLTKFTYGDPATGYSAPYTNAGEQPDRLLSCVETTPGSGVCASSDTGVAGIRGTLHDIDPKGTIIDTALLRNCTDPDAKTGTNCMYYATPGSPYAQLGDYVWLDRYGLVSNYKPNTGNAYKPNVVTHLGFIISGVKTPGPALSLSSALPQAMAENFSLVKAPLDTGTSQILYLGGHSYAKDVAGTRIVLNTMLALGLATTKPIETDYVGATEYNSNAFIPTYDEIIQIDAPPEFNAFSVGSEDQWRFPVHTGHLRAHQVSALSTKNNFSDAAKPWSGAKYTDAGQFVHDTVPGDRNIFTYLGGDVAVDAKKPNGVVQQGWRPVDIDYKSVDPTKGCVDNFHIGEINSTTKPNWSGSRPYPGMLPGGDGVCDLQEALQLSNVTPLFVDPTTGQPDNGAANGVKGGSIPAQFIADNNTAQAFTQMVRGFCYATDPTTGIVIPNPSRSQCNALRTLFNGGQDNAPGLGGFVHSQAAIVPASPFIADAPAGSHRPTVAYVGGLDGMLHAFYVPTDAGDHNYTGPANAVSTLTGTDASGTFHKALDSSVLTEANALKELWAFVPPGQLPLLQSNNAMVDSSPVVIDAYGDFDGSGVRRWHTVLVASAGGGNREMFALDVTNPLKPILLWDLQSSFADAVQYAPSPLVDDDTGKNVATQAQAFAWQNGCHANDPACIVSDFKLPPQGKPNTTGLYNYSNLGASQSISVAQMRRFNSPVFAAFVATNEPQDRFDKVMGSGMFVFAIDVTTGQKIWEFNNPYNLSDDPTDQQNGIGNTPPAGVTLLSKAGNSLIDTAYVGDDEGGLWELDAADGVNVNSFAPLLPSTSYASLCGNKQRCNFALSLAYGDGSLKAQPISSLSTVFILPTMPAASPLKSYEAQPLLAYGTGGTDTVAALEPAADANGNACPTGTTCISGKVHIIPLLPNYRYTPQDLLGTNSSTSLNAIQTWGIVKQPEPPGITLTNGERVYGSIVAAGDQLFYNTTTGSVSSIDARFGNLSGSTYRLLLSAAGPLSAYDYVKGNSLTKVGGAGGTPMLDATTGNVVVVTDKYVLRFPPPAGGTLQGPSVNGKGATPTGLLSWFFRRRGLEY